MVNQPSYNPNNRNSLSKDSLRNRAVTDVIEPGSTIKPFTVAAALMSGKVKPNAIIDTSPGSMRVGNYSVQDIRNYGRIDLTTILSKSSNVGATKLALAIPAEALWKIHNGVGFGFNTTSHFPGEVSGLLNFPSDSRQVEKATLSYGYGLSVTPLQLASAYGVLAASGIKHPISLVYGSEKLESTRVMDSKVANRVLKMLESVVTEEGTGKNAVVNGYLVAGKTGTVKKAADGGYSDNRYVSLFAGIAPATNPQLVMVVSINEPGGKKYYGGDVAAPVFANVMTGALRLMGVAPDNVNNAKKNVLALNDAQARQQ